MKKGEVKNLFYNYSQPPKFPGDVIYDSEGRVYMVADGAIGHYRALLIMNSWLGNLMRVVWINFMLTNTARRFYVFRTEDQR